MLVLCFSLAALLGLGLGIVALVLLIKGRKIGLAFLAVAIPLIAAPAVWILYAIVTIVCTGRSGEWIC